MHLTRYQMYNRIFSVLDLPLSGDILAISGIKYWQGSKNYTPLRKIIDDDARITNADYPKVHICDLPHENNHFDYVICDQVLEHVEGDIEKAVSEIHRVLKPGGIIVGPVGDAREQEMVKGVKRKDGTLAYEFLGQFLFSPMVGKWGFED